MQKIKLLSQYDSDALFLKTRKQVQDQIAQWPEGYFTAAQIENQIRTIKTSEQLSLPNIDFVNGREVLIERIYPVSVYQPGRKTNSKVRVNVLTYRYPFNGQIYLLGCRPPLSVPDPPGEWFADPISQEIFIEYFDYEKFPRKTITAHQKYVAELQSCYESLRQELIRCNEALDNVIEDSIKQRQSEIDDMKRMLSLLR